MSPALGLKKGIRHEHLVSVVEAIRFMEVPLTSIILIKNTKVTTQMMSAVIRHCIQSYISREPVSA